MTKSFRTPLLFSIFVAYAFYLNGVLAGNDLIGNTLSPVVALLCALMILVSIKKIKDFRLYAILLFFSTIAWFCADSIWYFYVDYAIADPESSLLISALYTFPNIAYVIVLTHYIFAM